MLNVISYIGLGSNLDGPTQQLSNALVAISNLPDTRLISCSSFYRSTALTLDGDSSVPDYINAVVSIETGLDALTLLDALQEIEFSQGRRRTGKRWVARQLDLDILLYGDEFIADERLNVPHPQMCLRDFVLAPLAEIAPELMIPGKGSISSCLAVCSQTIVDVIPDSA